MRPGTVQSPRSLGAARSAPYGAGMQPTPALAAVRANEQILGVMLVVHGFVHTAGFALAWEWFEPKGFSYDDVWPDAGTGPGRVVGVAWLLVALGLVFVGFRLANRRDPAVAEVATPLVASAVLCLMSSPHALPGAVLSGAVLGIMIMIRLRRARAGRATDRVGTEAHLEGSDP